MKKLTSLPSLLCCILLACGLVSCDDRNDKGKAGFSHIEQLNSPNYRMGLPLGAKSMHVAEEQLPNARPCYFNSPYAALTALLDEEIDAYIFDSHVLDYVAANSRDFDILPGTIGIADIAVGITPKKPELVHEVNLFIDGYKLNGTYNQMYDRWVKLSEEERAAFSRPDVPEMPKIDAPAAPTRTLVVGTCSQMEPMCFRKPGGEPTDLTGFDMELLQRLARHLNARIELRDLDYMSMMDMLVKGELDMVIAGLSRTEARRKRGILFSKNYIDSHIVALVRSNRVEKKK